MCFFIQIARAIDHLFFIWNQQAGISIKYRTQPNLQFILQVGRVGLKSPPYGAITKKILKIWDNVPNRLEHVTIYRVQTNLQFSDSNAAEYSIFNIEYSYFDVVQGVLREMR